MRLSKLTSSYERYATLWGIFISLSSAAAVVYFKHHVWVVGASVLLSYLGLACILVSFASSKAHMGELELADFQLAESPFLGDGIPHPPVETLRTSIR